MPRLELLDGPKVVHGSLLVARTTEHLQVEPCAGIEEVRAVVNEVLFEGGVLVSKMHKLSFQFGDPGVELVHGIRIHSGLD